MKRIHKDEGEFSTDILYYSERTDTYFLRHSNGGSRGAHDRMTNSGWKDRDCGEPETLTRAEAEAWLLSQGVDVDDIDSKLDGDDGEDDDAVSESRGTLAVPGYGADDDCD